MSELDAEKEVDEILKVADIDGSGEIDFTEFITATIDKKKLLTTDKVAAAFKAFDTDNSGTINEAELHQMIGAAIDERVLKDAFRSVDRDQSGEIDLEEFKEMLSKLT